MINRISHYLRPLLSSSLIYFIIFIFTCLALVNFRIIRFKKLNYLREESAHYPLLYQNDQSPLAQKNLYLSSEYYSSFISSLKDLNRLADRPLSFSHTFSQAYGVLAYCQYYLGKKNRALKNFQKAIDSEPQVDHYFNLSVIFYERGDAKQSLKYLEQVFPGILNQLAKAQALWKKARNENDIEKKTLYQLLTISLSRASRNAIKLQIANYFETQNYQAIVDTANSIGDLDFIQKDPFINFYKGLAFYQLRLDQKAARSLSKTLTEEPFSAPSYYYLGLILKRLGQNSASEKMMSQAGVFQEGDLPKFKPPLLLNPEIYQVPIGIKSVLREIHLHHEK